MNERRRQPAFVRGVPGIAHPLHIRIARELAARGMGKAELAKIAKVSRNTLDQLAWIVNPPHPTTVAAIADALDIDREEAAELAGLVPTTPDDASAPVREAIASNPVFTDAQRRTLLQMVEIIDAANRQRIEETG